MSIRYEIPFNNYLLLFFDVLGYCKAIPNSSSLVSRNFQKNVSNFFLNVIHSSSLLRLLKVLIVAAIHGAYYLFNIARCCTADMFSVQEYDSSKYSNAIHFH